jgi:hypothetical protein
LVEVLVGGNLDSSVTVLTGRISVGLITVLVRAVPNR